MHVCVAMSVSFQSNFKSRFNFFHCAHNTVTLNLVVNNFKPTFWTQVATVLDINAPLGRT